MFSLVILLSFLSISADADFFQFDSISNVSTYYLNYIYCNIWDGDCQPHQDDATQQGKDICIIKVYFNICYGKIIIINIQIMYNVHQI